MRRLIAALVLVSIVASCGGIRSSRLNPFNWFGRDREQRIEVTEAATFVDPRGLVAQVVKLKVDRMPGGAIIHAFGLPATQGHWEGALIPLNNEFPDKGVLVYEFRLLPPKTPQPAGTTRSREVVIGHFVSDQTLQGVRRIKVVAQQNSRTVRR